MQRIAVLTSGGDAPGMNAAIRAVVRTCLERGCEVFGVRQGFSGLIAEDYVSLRARDVGGIIHLGGTMLGSARSLEFKTEKGQLQALSNLHQKKIEGLIVIGGNGSQAGANALSLRGFPVVGIASTIDSDLVGSDMTIGVNTALNVALEAIDRLKVTASSHHRAFLVEVMGRNCGYLALMAAISGGAEAVAIPEVATDPETVADDLRAAYDNGKSSAIVIVAEGASYNAEGMANFFQVHRERFGFDLRITKLGHVQRGGAPISFDRLLGTLLGAAACQQLLRSEHGVLMGVLKGEIATTPLTEVVANHKHLDLSLLDLAKVLAK